MFGGGRRLCWLARETIFAGGANAFLVEGGLIKTVFGRGEDCLSELLLLSLLRRVS